MSTGLYIHIPFCSQKCIYCDFYSISTKIIEWQNFSNALLNEFRVRKSEVVEKISTIYIGGGTPSLLPIDILIELISNLKAEAGKLWQPTEFTIEVNPDDVNTNLIENYLNIGVDRISMGIQSFNDIELTTIRRRHNSEQIYQAFNCLSAIKNKSIDLIFGLPYQTLNSWKLSIDKAIDLRPQHISAYSLMYEEGTTIYLMRQQGKIVETDDELSSEMFQLLADKLKKAGYLQYEISNFALPGYESKHNSSYWTGKPYLGLGPAAHSYNGESKRMANPSNVSAYINHFKNKVYSTPFFIEEYLSDNDRYNEYVMTRLRTSKGINLIEFQNKFATKFYDYFISMAEQHIEIGNLKLYDNTIYLTNKGILISDSIFSDLIFI